MRYPEYFRYDNRGDDYKGKIPQIPVDCIDETVWFVLRSMTATGLWGAGFTLITDVISPGELPGLYKPQDPIKVNGVGVKLVGVAHDTSNFFEHEEQIRHQIVDSRFVILEYFPYDSGLSLPGQNRDQFNVLTALNERSFGFFAALGGLCAEYNKDIYVINPENPFMQFLEFYAMFGLSTALIYGDVKYTINKLLNRRATRRNFLKMLGYGISGATFASWYSDFSNYLNNLDSPDDISSMRWNLIDFRDLVSAKRIINIIDTNSSEIESDQLISVFQGDIHTAGVLKYLQNPDLVDYKDWAYPHYQAIASFTKRYSYDRVDNKWVLKK